jgi:hypothetical protein
MVMVVAEAVPRTGFTATVADLALQAEGLPAAD